MQQQTAKTVVSIFKKGIIMVLETHNFDIYFTPTIRAYI